MGFPPEKHGSFEDFAIKICREMKTRGHIPHLTFPTAVPSWLEVSIHEAGGKLACTKLITRPWTPGSLWKYLKEKNIDVLHLHLVNTLVGWYWGQTMKRPLVVTLHVTRNYHNTTILDIAARFRARLIYRSAKLIAISDFMKCYAYQLKFDLRPDQIIRIYNGIDAERFRPTDNRERIRRKLGWEPDSIMFITVSHLRKDKGIEILLKAFARVAFDFSRLQLAVVGDGPELEALKILADNLKIGDRVHWMGRRNDAERLLPAADVFVLTPTWEEPFGYVFAEAQSCGLPVITCRSGGIPEIISDKKTGLIVEKNDICGLAAAIAKVTDDPTFRQELAQRARCNAMVNFNIQDQVRSVVDLYEAELWGMNRSR